MATSAEITNWMNTYNPEMRSASQEYGVPTLLFQQQLFQESQYNPAAQNGDAYGIAQFMPGTANDFGINPADPIQSIDAAAQYDSQLYQKTGSWLGAMQSYGTLPSSGPLSTGQQIVANMAKALDANSSGSGSGAGGLPGGLLGSSGAGAGGGTLGTLGSVAGNLLGSSGSMGGLGGSGSQGTFSSFLTEVVERGALIIFGLVLVIGAFYLLGQRSSGASSTHYVPVQV